MGRPKSKAKFMVRDKNRTNWYIEYFSEEKKGKITRATEYSMAEYTREMVQRIVDSETGTKRTTEYSIDWLEQHNDHLLRIDQSTEKTLEGYRNAFMVLRAVYSDDYSVKNIDRAAISKIKGYCMENGNRPATINTYLTRLRAAFDRIYIEDIIPKNPFYKFKRLTEPNDKQKHFTLAEVQRLLKILETHPNRKLAHLLRISLYTALRRGEVLRIKRSDVRFGELSFRAIDIKSRDKGTHYKPMPKAVVKDFEYFMNNYPGEYPFNVYQPNGYTAMTKKLFKQHRFSSDLKLHSARHTGITNALENGQSLRDVQHGVGHKNQRTTEIYAHDMKPMALKIDYGEQNKADSLADTEVNSDDA